MINQPDELSRDNPESMCELFNWLDMNELTFKGTAYESEFNMGDFEKEFKYNPFVIAVPSNRVKKKSKSEIEKIKETKEKLFSDKFLDDKNFERIFREILKLKEKVRLLDIKKLSPDAMAFYRPFHITPFDQWGIYFFVEKILNYFHYLERKLEASSLMTKELLASYVLFEIFHHEFFHHIVESTATTIEIIYSATQNKVNNFYLDHLRRNYNIKLSDHLHQPLEEALANAYAYNSFSFISSVSNIPIRFSSVQYYQELMKHYWKTEPPGYKFAEFYIKGGQIGGACDLLYYLFNNPELKVPLQIIAERVFPSGYTAYISKPYIPVYLVGDETNIKTLYDLVPAPNEAYVNLFWPGKTEELDNYIRKRKEEEKEKERKRKAALKNRQNSLFP